MASVDKLDRDIELARARLLKYAEKIKNLQNRALSLLFLIRNTPYHYGTIEQRAFLNDPRLPELEGRINKILEVSVEELEQETA